MKSYDELLDIATENGLIVFEKRKFKNPDLNALIANNIIGLSEKLETSSELICALAEEIAHYLINTGKITDLRNIENARQEYRAHKLAVNMTISLTDIVKASVKLGEESTIYNVADELGVTEKFLLEAIEIYRRTYGEKLDIGSYIICFHPFHIREKHK